MPFWLRIFSCKVSPRPPQRLVGRAVKRGGHHDHRRYCKPRLYNLSDGIRRGGGRKPCHSRCIAAPPALRLRSEEHTSELQSLMRISYAVFCLKKKRKTTQREIRTNS